MMLIIKMNIIEYISMEGDKARKQHIKHDKEHHTVDGRNPAIAGMYQIL